MSGTSRFLEDHPDASSFEDAVHTDACRCSEELRRLSELRPTAAQEVLKEVLDSQRTASPEVWQDDATGSKEAA